MNDFRLRQVHLDFHTSPEITGIGEKFDKTEWQAALRAGHINSITVFSKCHHGYSYHPTAVNEMHPHLCFDLLQAQLEACAEIGVRAPIYISVGFDEKDAVSHPEWLVQGRDCSGDFSRPGFHLLCLNTPYLDKLLSEIDEVMERYNPCEIFLDIVGERVCTCASCRRDMTKMGLDYLVDEDCEKFGKIVYRNYLDKVYETVKKHNPDTTVFQNSGHLTIGRRDLVDTVEDLELESLPTGGWGYDHFPLSASYARTIRENYLGMTGKFHGTWGEFGGFKHPNALRYEAALSLSQGAGCSVGDQMHSEGKLNESTYDLIGRAYSEVEQKEPWCVDAKYIADIGVLSVEALCGRFNDKKRADVGANRVLLENKSLYNFIDSDEDFSKYKLLILPDFCRFDGKLKCKISQFLANGGKLILSGQSGLDEANGFAVDIGIKHLGENELSPNYLIPNYDSVNGYTEYVMRQKCYRFENIDGEVLAFGQDPYFNRTPHHFCSHQHAPNDRALTYPTVVRKGNVAYIGWEIFKAYAENGDFHIKELLRYVINTMMGDDATVKTQGLPDRGIATLTRQQNREILHLLFAHTTIRGNSTEIIEDIVPVCNIAVSVKTAEPKRVLLVPEKIPLDFTYANCRVEFTVPRVEMHQMVEIG